MGRSQMGRRGPLNPSKLVRFQPPLPIAGVAQWKSGGLISPDSRQFDSAFRHHLYCLPPMRRQPITTRPTTIPDGAWTAIQSDSGSPRQIRNQIILYGSPRWSYHLLALRIHSIMTFPLILLYANQADRVIWRGVVDSVRRVRVPRLVPISASPWGWFGLQNRGQEVRLLPPVPA